MTTIQDVHAAFKRVGLKAKSAKTTTTDVTVTVTHEEWELMRKLLIWGASEAADRRLHGEI